MQATIYDTSGGRQPDSRITAAAEFLTSARKRKVGELPHSVLLREAAELRRLLGQALDVIGSQPILDAGIRHTLVQVFADAISYRESHLGVRCVPCEVHPAGLCEVHAAHLDLADRYRILGCDVFGIEVGR
jgi:hypothetical protein